MSAARYNLIIDQGTDFALEFIVKESGTAKNLSSGFSARAQIRPTKDHVGDPTKVFECLIQDGSVTGKITAKLTNTQTSAIAAGRYYYDLELVHSSVVTRLLEGTVTVTQEVTR
mgnify:FL=1|tara:strand:- start:311 stop:652 length:342 start_codon:yes stop_codon:yes gene_type:complete